MSIAEIENVCAVKKIEIPVEPGEIIYLVGPNGSGKSTAINAVASVVGGTKPKLSPRDGISAGMVKFSGATLKVGSRMTAKGQAEGFILCDDGDAIGGLIDPGVKDPKAADRKRIEAISTLTGFELTDEQVAEYVGESVELTKGEPTERVSELKRILEKKSREAEDLVTGLDGQLAEIGEVGELPDVVDTAPLQQAVRDADAIYRQAVIDSAAAKKARQVLDVCGDVDHSAELDELGKSIQELFKAHTDTIAAITELQAKQRKIENELSGSQSRFDILEKAQKSSEAARKELASLDSVDVEDAHITLDAANHALSEANKTNSRRDEITALRTRRASLVSQKDQAHARAETLRDKAKGCRELLNPVVDAVEWLKIDENMRLCCEHKRGWIPFDELSPGEKATRVVELCCQFANKGTGDVPVIVLPQHIFESIDAAGRTKLKAIAVENSVCILTAQCSQEFERNIHVERV